MVKGAKAAVLSTKADVFSQLAQIQAEEKRRAKELLLSKEVHYYCYEIKGVNVIDFKLACLHVYHKLLRIYG